MNRVELNYGMLLVVLALLGLGMVMVYSSSAVFALETYGDSLFFTKRQSMFLVMGLCAMTVGLAIPSRFFYHNAYWLLALAVGLLVLVMVPGLGHRAGGATRWLSLGFFKLQVGEIVKVCLIAYLAMSLAKKADQMAVFRVGVVPHLMVLGVVATCLLQQPDFGTTVLLTLVTLTMLFCAGARLRHIFGLFAAVIPLGIYFVVAAPYRMKRITAFLDPWTHREGVGYQVVESLLTFGSGQMTGLGLGDGRQKLFFLPAAHTDFIFAVIGEETGFVGTAAILGLFFIFMMMGFQAVSRQHSRFERYLALGLTCVFAYQTLFNVFVVLGLLPTKGITLPFISYGGSSLILSCFMAGMLLRLASRETPEET
ncbi:MAG: putative lipid II flippase FtsW [Myxococcales bacterium]|nr:putative lipid II flippase FtsW [Myxococcales bacterium]|tara:strand:- start:1520 stop:2623 length:1104 start_codon:yes stop_codon:yes gene_type:complete